MAVQNNKNKQPPRCSNGGTYALTIGMTQLAETQEGIGNVNRNDTTRESSNYNVQLAHNLAGGPQSLEVRDAQISSLDVALRHTPRSPNPQGCPSGLQQTDHFVPSFDDASALREIFSATILEPGGNALKDLEQDGSRRTPNVVQRTTTTDKSVGTKNSKTPQTEQERIEERNRKGRERSLRTRQRNAARLRNLQDNCAYLHRENEILLRIAYCIRQSADFSVVATLLRTLAVCRRNRPPPHVFSSAAIENTAYFGTAVGTERMKLALTESELWGSRLDMRQNAFSHQQQALALPLATLPTESSLQESSITATNTSEPVETVSVKQESRFGSELNDTCSTNVNRIRVAETDGHSCMADALESYEFSTEPTALSTQNDLKESTARLEGLRQVSLEDLLKLNGRSGRRQGP